MFILLRGDLVTIANAVTRWSELHNWGLTCYGLREDRAAWGLVDVILTARQEPEGVRLRTERVAAFGEERQEIARRVAALVKEGCDKVDAWLAVNEAPEFERMRVQHRHRVGALDDLQRRLRRPPRLFEIVSDFSDEVAENTLRAFPKLEGGGTPLATAEEAAAAFLAERPGEVGTGDRLEAIPGGRAEWVPKTAKKRAQWLKAYNLIRERKEEADDRPPQLADFRDHLRAEMGWAPGEKTVGRIIRAGEEGWLS